MRALQIERSLDRIGFDRRHKGFRYIVDYLLLLDDEEWRGAKATAMYYKIAKAHGVHVTCIQQAIKRQFDYFREMKGTDAANWYIGTGNRTAVSLRILYERIGNMETEDVMTADKVREIVKEELMFALRVFFPERVRDVH